MPSPTTRMVRVDNETLDEALRLRPTSTSGRVIKEALRDWIEREKRRVQLIAEAEAK